MKFLPILIPLVFLFFLTKSDPLKTGQQISEAYFKKSHSRKNSIGNLGCTFIAQSLLMN